MASVMLAENTAPSTIRRRGGSVHPAAPSREFEIRDLRL